MGVRRQKIENRGADKGGLPVEWFGMAEVDFFQMISTTKCQGSSQEKERFKSWGGSAAFVCLSSSPAAIQSGTKDHRTASRSDPEITLLVKKGMVPRPKNTVHCRTLASTTGWGPASQDFMHIPIQPCWASQPGGGSGADLRPEVCRRGCQNTVTQITGCIIIPGRSSGQGRWTKMKNYCPYPCSSFYVSFKRFW